MSGNYGYGQQQPQWQSSATDGQQTKALQSSPMQSAYASKPTPSPYASGDQPVTGFGGESGYADYMNRRKSWIDELRGHVAQPQAIGGSGGSFPTWGGQPGAGVPPQTSVPPGDPSTWGGRPGSGGPPATSAPPGGPYPGAAKAGSAQPDYMGQFGSLLGEDPRLAYGMTFGGPQQQWFQQNQMQIMNKLFGGNQDRFNQFINSSAYANPLTAAERARIGV